VKREWVRFLDSIAREAGFHPVLVADPCRQPRTKPSQMPEEPRTRSGWLCRSQPLKSPMTATRSASGAQTAK